jgi:nucleotide-binding universal stress UspA family protein
MKTILAPVDFSAATKGVVAAAKDLAKLTGGRMVLLHALQLPLITTEYGLTAEALNEAMEVNTDAARKQLAHLEKRLADDTVPVTSRLITGFGAGVIIEQAKKLRASYIVLGSHGHTAFYDLLVGGTTHAVLKKAPCPVLVVPPGKTKKSRN